MKKLLLLAGFVFAVALPLQGAEKIEGAFGLKLGDVFEMPAGTKLEPTKYPSGIEFTPHPGNPTFSEYWVLITPNTHRIYQIHAYSESPHQKAQGGYPTFDRVAAFLARKYSDKPVAPAGKFVVDQGTRHLEVDNTQGGYSQGREGTEYWYKIEVTYTDLILEKQAEAERLQNVMDALLPTADGTGL